MTVTQDGTNFIPQNAGEFTTLLAGSNIANPSTLLLCQEANGSLADSIGALVFAASGSPTYQNTISGRTKKAVHVSASACFKCTDASLPNIGAASIMIFAWVHMPASFGSFKNYGLCFGDTYHHQAGWFSADATHMGAGHKTGAGVTAGTVDARGLTVPVIVQFSHATGLAVVQTSLETISATVDTPSGKEVFLGGDNGSNADPGEAFDLLYLALWTGSNAELDATGRASLLDRFTNGPPPLPPAGGPPPFYGVGEGFGPGFDSGAW